MEKGLSLYTMTAQMMELIEAEDCDGEAIERAFGDIAAKDCRIAHFVKDLTASAEAHKVEAKRIADRGKALENKAAQLKAYVQSSMELMQVDSLVAGTFKISIQKNPPALKVIDASLCPPEFQIVIPQSVVEDTAKIKDTLKAGGTVPGYELSVGKSLMIR